jgi:hypothetical protein
MQGAYHVAAGEVEHTPLLEEASTPHPMGNRAIDEEMPDGKEDEHRGHLHALRVGAGGDGRGDDRKGELEHYEDGFGDGAHQRGRSQGGGICNKNL